MQEQALRFEITADDVRCYARFTQKRRERRTLGGKPGRIALRLLAVLGAVALLLMVTLSVLTGSLAWTEELAADPLLRTVALVLMAVVALWVTLRIALPHLALLGAKQTPHTMGPREVRLRAEGLEVVSGAVRTQIGWSGFLGLESSGDAFYVLLGANQALIVPHRAFADEREREAFRDTVARHIAGGGDAVPPG